MDQPYVNVPIKEYKSGISSLRQCGLTFDQINDLTVGTIEDATLVLQTTVRHIWTMCDTTAAMLVNMIRTELSN